MPFAKEVSSSVASPSAAAGLMALFVFSTLYAFGASLANPTVSSLSSALTPKERQGEMFGLMQAARSLGFMAGPALGGALFDWRAEAPYLLAGGVCALAVLLLAKHSGRAETDARASET
jgi:MFS family permease